MQELTCFKIFFSTEFRAGMRAGLKLLFFSFYFVCIRSAMFEIKNNVSTQEKNWNKISVWQTIIFFSTTECVTGMSMSRLKQAFWSTLQKAFCWGCEYFHIIASEDFFRRSLIFILCVKFISLLEYLFESTIVIDVFDKRLWIRTNFFPPAYAQWLTMRLPVYIQAVYRVKEIDFVYSFASLD